MSLQLSKLYYQSGNAVEHYYLCNYRPIYDGYDNLSKSLIRFKAGLQDDLRAWTDCAVNELQQLGFPNDVIVVRPLGSRETAVDDVTNTPLDTLGKAIADAFGVRWMPGLIKKHTATHPLKSLSAKERNVEIQHVYSLSENYFDFNEKRVLLIDDILTTGATASSIIRLVKQYFPRSRFKVFTLAKSSHGNALNHSVHLAGLSYDWEENAGWTVAEEAMEYDHYARLVNAILKDDFSWF